ncbi:hypothetical protein ES703_56126 [subsurface metagenome]
MLAEGELSCLAYRGFGQRDVTRHLVAIKISVERRADQRVNLDGAAINENGLKCLDAEAMQSRRPVQPDRSFLYHFLEYIVDFRFGSFHKSPGALDVRSESLLYQAVHDKRFKEFQGHSSGQTALVQSELRANHDNGATAVVDPFSQQVLTEAPLFTTEHVGK